MKKLLIILSLAFAVLPVATLAAQLEGGETYASGVDEVVSEDLYIGAAMISVGGPVEGDLVAAGGKAVVGGDVSEDLILAGGDLVVLGDVGDDARVAGGDITITSNVGGDLVVAGGNVHVASTATVSGDIIAAAGVLIIDGVVEGDIKVGAGALVVNGTVQGEITAETDEVEFGSSSVVEGNINYKAVREAKIGEGAELNGEVVFEERAVKSINHEGAKAIAGLLGLAWLGKLIMQLVAALILLWLTPKAVSSVVRQATDKFGQELVRGFVVLVVSPVAIIVLAVTVIGLMLAVPAGLVYATLVAFAKLLAGITLGALLLQWFKSEQPHVSWKSAVLGVIVLNIVAVIPVIGWIIAAVLFLVTLGSLSLHIYQHLLSTR